MIPLPDAEVFRAQPVAPVVVGRLKAAGANPPFVDRWVARQQTEIDERLKWLGLAVALSHPDTSITPADASDPETEQFIRVYQDKQKHQPRAKWKADARMADSFMTTLGISNPLHTAEGLDASAGLSSIVKLLADDYDAMPDDQKKPEDLIVKARAQQELAILWNANTRPDGAPRSAVFRLDNPELLAQDDLDVPERTRWRKLGAALSRQAAETFREVSYSLTVKPIERLEALSAMTDMEIRSLGLVAMPRNLMEIEIIHIDRGVELRRTFQSGVLEPTADYGPFFRLYGTHLEGDRVLEAGGANRLWRSAAPREVSLSPNDWPARRKGDPKRGGRRNPLDFSFHMVVEDTNGCPVERYQFKSMTRAKYQEISDAPLPASPWIPLPGYITGVRVLDDYPLDPRRRDYRLANLKGLVPF